jgi:hypothetical protein
MTETQYKEAHIAQWHWLFNNPAKDKSDWPGWQKNGGMYDECERDCFACEICKGECYEFCPLIMPACHSPRSPYLRWSNAPKSWPNRRKRFAAIIRDSWREIPLDRDDDNAEAKYRAGHIALWDWLYHHPSKLPENWPGWISNAYRHIEYIRSFGCDFSYFECDACPLELKTCNRKDSVLAHWYQAKSPKSRKKYAAIMRDSWREIPE